MRVAVLLSGQPRFLDEGSAWFKNIFPPSYRILKVDYYCHFWDNGDPDLASKIENTYNPVKYKIDNYDEVIRDFREDIKNKNKNLPNYDWEYVPRGSRFLLYAGDDVPTYAKNFWGQFLSCQYITEMTGDLSDQYDIIIKTRSDVALNDQLTESHWLQAFRNIHRNQIFDDKMLSQWMYVKHGIPYVGDFTFISKPKNWYNFSKNIREHCLKLATEDKVLWREMEVSKFGETPHWIWAKTSMYSQTNWLSFGVVWPIPFSATVIRKHSDDITKHSFEELVTMFNESIQ